MKKPKDDAKTIEAETEKKPKGQILKELREGKGLSLELVHEATKIPMDALRAIEEGYTIRTLSHFYIRGFIKIYAKYLSVDPSEVLEDFHEEQLPQYIKQDIPHRKFELFMKSFWTRQRKRQGLIILAAFFGLFCLFKVITFFTASKESIPKSIQSQATSIDKNIPKEPVKNKKTKPKVVVRSKVKKDIKKKVPKVVAASQVPVQKTAVSKKLVRLTVHMKKKSWLRVKADGETVFQSTLRLGAVETWEADEKIEVSGGNLHELEFELNGKLIGSLGRADRKVKQIVVTKDGLSVTK